MWNPWRGCKKCSDGCLYCYIHKGDAKRGVDPSVIEKTKDFAKPAQRLKNGNYKMKSGIVYTCFSSDFLIEEADGWRPECWKMIRERSDCTFLFLTKRIHRLADCLPEDWEDGYENVVVCCTVENQTNADEKLDLFSKLPIKHKCITAQPLLEAIQIERYLDGVELVVVGVNRIPMPGRSTTIGCWISESNASEKTCLSNSDNAERILSRTARNIPWRKRFCARRQEKPISISNAADRIRLNQPQSTAAASKKPTDFCSVGFFAFCRNGFSRVTPPRLFR